MPEFPRAAILQKLVEITFPLFPILAYVHKQNIRLIIFSGAANFLKPWECFWTGAISSVLATGFYTVLEDS